jgi:hypothetical protein
MAATRADVKVKGLRELRQAFKAMDREVSRELDNELKGIAQAVADEARNRFSAIDARSASGFKPRLRGFGSVLVVQTRRSKHVRPDFGSLQMRRALIPALWAKASDTERAVDSMLARLEHRHGF